MESFDVTAILESLFFPSKVYIILTKNVDRTSACIGKSGVSGISPRLRMYGQNLSMRFLVIDISKICLEY